MATLESLVYDRLSGDATLTALLARWGGAPAVFIEQAPGSESKRWDSPNVQSPRVVLSVSRVQDPTRGSDATLLIGLFGPSDALPALAARVQTLSNGVPFHPDDEPPLWTRLRTNDPDPNLALLAGAEDAQAISLDVIALPDSPAFDPDPIAALYGLSATVLIDAESAPTAQTDPATWDADSPLPAVYWALRNETLLRRWPVSYQWNAEVRCFVLGPDATARQQVARQLAQALALTPRIALSPAGWLKIDRSISLDFSADPLRQGQLSATAEFWTQKPPSGADRIATVEVRGADVPLLEVPVS